MGIKQSKTECLIWICPECGYVDTLSIPQKKDNKKNHKIYQQTKMRPINQRKNAPQN